MFAPQCLNPTQLLPLQLLDPFAIVLVMSENPLYLETSVPCIGFDSILTLTTHTDISLRANTRTGISYVDSTADKFLWLINIDALLKPRCPGTPDQSPWLAEACEPLLLVAAVQARQAVGESAAQGAEARQESGEDNSSQASARRQASRAAMHRHPIPAPPDAAVNFAPAVGEATHNSTLACCSAQQNAQCQHG